MNKIRVRDNIVLDFIEDTILHIDSDKEIVLSIHGVKSSHKLLITIDSNSKVIVYHNSVDTSDEIIVDLNGEKAELEYHYNTINYTDNKTYVTVNHNSRCSESNIYNHGVNVKENALEFIVTGSVKKDNDKCICNQENQIINMNNGDASICPNLLIDNYDCFSNHSAYIGKFKEDYLFYLMSRGLSLKSSYRLLLKGFLLRGQEDSESFLEEINKI